LYVSELHDVRALSLAASLTFLHGWLLQVPSQTWSSIFEEGAGEMKGG